MTLRLSGSLDGNTNRLLLVTQGSNLWRKVIAHAGLDILRGASRARDASRGSNVKLSIVDYQKTSRKPSIKQMTVSLLVSNSVSRTKRYTYYSSTCKLIS